MYLLYLDDSGSAANQNEQHLVLAGVCVFERRVHGTMVGSHVEPPGKTLASGG
jgi:hypothetical protein